MNRTVTLLTGAGLGVGLMFFLDPRQGRRRRATLRDKTIRMAHQAGDAAEVVGRDLRNRTHGLACGDWSVLIGGRRALRQPLRGGWSPSGRAVMTLLGSGLVLTGLTRSAPTACVLGSIGLGMIAEGISNAGIEDIRHLPANVTQAASTMAERVTSIRQRAADDGRTARRPQPSGAIG